MTDAEAKAILASIPPTEVPAPMDPNATLELIRNLVRLSTSRTLNDSSTSLTPAEADELVEAIDMLDKYISNGGNIPRDWRPFLC